MKASHLRMEQLRRVAVVNPWVHDFKLYDEWMHPVGLYFLISLLQEHGIETRLFNCLKRWGSSQEEDGTGHFSWTQIPKPLVAAHLNRRFKRYGVSPDSFSAFLTEQGPFDAVMVGSGMTYWIEGVQATVNHIRDVLPPVPIVVGGSAARLMPGALSGGEAHVFTGDLAPDSLVQSEIPFIRSLACSEWEPSLIPALSLADNRYHAPVLLSHGCPLKCTYCASSILNRKYRARPHELVAEETRFAATRLGVRDFCFYDDALLVNAESVLFPYLDSIRSRGLSLRFHTPNGLHLRLMTSTTAARMREMGFATVRFGYESTSSNRRQDTDGKVSREIARSGIARAREAGFQSRQIGVYVMAGLPGQRPHEVVEELTFVNSLQVRAMPVFYSPVPRTPLFEYYCEQFPDLASNPHLHNDTLFTSLLCDWGNEGMELVRSTARKLNSRLEP